MLFISLKESVSIAGASIQKGYHEARWQQAFQAFVPVHSHYNNMLTKKVRKLETLSIITAKRFDL
jgi:hypothetical protein